MEAVGDDADIVAWQIGDTVGIVGSKFTHHARLGGLIIIIIRFVTTEHTVAFTLDGCFRLVDRKVEGCRQFGIAPRLALFDEK